MIILAHVLEACCSVMHSPKLDHTDTSSSWVADWLLNLILSALFFNESFRHPPGHFHIPPNVVGTQSRRLQVAVFFVFQLPAGRHINNREMKRAAAVIDLSGKNRKGITSVVKVVNLPCKQSGLKFILLKLSIPMTLSPCIILRTR